MTGFCRKTAACKRAHYLRYYALRGDLKREINQRWVDNHPEKARESWNRAQKKKKQKEGRICRYAECSNVLKPGWTECLDCSRARLRAKREEPARKKALVERDGWQCTWCGQSLLDDFDAAVIDHIIPVTRGGPRDPQWNQQVLHPQCNRKKMNLITDRARSVAAEHGYELVRVDGRQIFRRRASAGSSK
jgi:5-methylcytosine-specific restriction endonuclease McrA